MLYRHKRHKAAHSEIQEDQIDDLSSKGSEEPVILNVEHLESEML